MKNNIKFLKYLSQYLDSHMNVYGKEGTFVGDHFFIVNFLILPILAFNVVLSIIGFIFGMSADTLMQQFLTNPLDNIFLMIFTFVSYLSLLTLATLYINKNYMNEVVKPYLKKFFEKSLVKNKDFLNLDYTKLNDLEKHLKNKDFKNEEELILEILKYTKDL